MSESGEEICFENQVDIQQTERTEEDMMALLSLTIQSKLHVQDIKTLQAFSYEYMMVENKQIVRPDV